MPKLLKQIAERNAKMKGENFLTDAQKFELEGVTGKARTFAVNQLRQKYQDTTDDLQLRYNKDKGELKEKPLSFSADSMSKVGLYSASGVAFNPLLGVAQKQLSALQTIAKNTSRGGGTINDPFSP